MNGTEVDYTLLVQSKAHEGLGTKEVQALFVKSIDNNKRQITALASAGTLDRDGEVILPSAFKELLPLYMKNPVVITSHQHRLQTGHSSVVANVVEAWVDKKGLWVIIEFVEGTELGKEYWHLYSTKKQRAFSVGFIPKEHTIEEHEGKRVTVLTKVELLEISCVAVPSNREALSRSKQRKADFVLAKKEEAEEEKFLAQMRAEDPDFDKKADEFGAALLGYKIVDGELVETNEFDCHEDEFECDQEHGKACDFAKIIRGENKSYYASLVAG